MSISLLHVFFSSMWTPHIFSIDSYSPIHQNLFLNSLSYGQAQGIMVTGPGKHT